MKDFIIFVYFAFTTLSTVGFGDFNPRSDAERCVQAFIMLFGVTIFSYIMGNFIEILQAFQASNVDNGDEEDLERMFKVLTKFNKGIPIKEEFRNEVWNYMQYKWSVDKNEYFKPEG